MESSKSYERIAFMQSSRDDKFTVGLVQMSCLASQFEGERGRKPCRGFAEAAAPGAQVVCLQELFRSGYFCRKRRSAPASADAETIPGPSTETIGSLPRVEGGGDRSLFERERPVCITIPLRSLALTERYGHIPQDAYPGRSAILRKILFHAGRSGLPEFRHAYTRVGVCVCWDQWYPGERA